MQTQKRFSRTPQEWQQPTIAALGAPPRADCRSGARSSMGFCSAASQHALRLPGVACRADRGDEAALAEVLRMAGAEPPRSVGVLGLPCADFLIGR